METPSKSSRRCPTCNSKRFPCPCRSRKQKPLIDTFTIFCVVCIAVVVVVALWTKKQRATPQSARTDNTSIAPVSLSPHGKKIHALETEYYREKIKHPEIWWLDALPKNPEDPVFHEKILSRERLIKNTLDRFRKVSPLAEAIHAKFDVFTVSIFIGGKASIAVKTPSELKQSKVEICFVPRTHATALEKSINAPSSVYWRSDWGMFVNAVEIPATVFAGLLYHELGHGLRHPVSLTGVGYFPTNSDANAAEEIEMHELETKVFNESSDGAFEKILTEIVLRNPKIKSVEEAMAETTAHDLTRLDTSIGANKAGIETSSLLFAHYLIAVGTTYLDTKKSGVEEKIRMFRFLHKEVLDIPVHLR